MIRITDTNNNTNDMVKQVIASPMDVVGNINHEGEEEEVSITSDDDDSVVIGQGGSDGDDEEADAAVAAEVDMWLKNRQHEATAEAVTVATSMQHNNTNVL